LEVVALEENLDTGHSRYDAKEDAGAAGDIGAGTGQFAIAVAPACTRVVAVDVSAVMLEQLRPKVVDAGLTNIEVVQAGFLSYEPKGVAADFVYSRLALHHLPDFWKVLALDRLSRILRPGGVLRLCDVVYSFNVSEAEERIEAWCASASSESDSS
jgi:ubiquinone/menaquinone biosynthesis C-methylase UbiE